MALKLLREQVEEHCVDYLIEENAETKEKDYWISGTFLEAETKNKNGRIYPLPILEKEVNRYNEEKVLKNRAFGECSHPQCFSTDEFDVLTKDGWKKFAELEVGMDVATYGENGAIDFQPIKTLVKEDYQGKMYRFKGLSIDATVTPNHRFLITDRYGEKKFVTASEIYLNRTVASKWSIPKTSTWVGNGEKIVTIKGITEERYNAGGKRWKRDYREDLTFDASIFFALVGIYLSEGCLMKKRSKGIIISQKKQPELDYIRQLLNKFSDLVDVVEYKNKRDVVSFVIRDIRLYEYFESLGDCYNKYIPQHLKEYNAEYLEILLDWYGIGDGRKSKSKYKKHENIFSTSKRMIDDLQECLIKIGMCGNIHTAVTKKDYMYADHLVKAVNKQPIYVLNIGTSKNIYLDDRFMSMEEVEHDGKVYCLTVDNGTFYIRLNNKMFWTGNSPDLNVERISHIITELRMDGNAGIGKAKILDTDLGRNIKVILKAGGQLGVSTRGIGSMKDDRVGNDYRLIAVDIVGEPSAEAWVESILESKEYVIKDNKLVEIAVDTLEKETKKNGSKYLKEALMQYLGTIRRGF